MSATLSVQLERAVYFPGETVKGNLVVQNPRDLQCRGIRVTLQGKGHSRFTTGSGKNKKTHTHTQMYVHTKKTVWGNVMKTPIVKDAGANAIFGPPWSPDEGVLYVPMTNEQHLIVIRVMDYNWCTRDDVLGEVHLDTREWLDKGDGEVIAHQLRFKGATTESTVSATMRWETDHSVLSADASRSGAGYRTLRLQIHQALNLRSAEWFGGKNDVYVQAFALPVGVSINASEPLPSPNESLTLTPCNLTIPFQFQLPADLPSSMVHSVQNYVAYSIYANIDIAWRLDVTHRVFFTIVQPTPVSLYLFPTYKAVDRTIYPQGCLPPFCCCNFDMNCFGPYGTMKINAYLERFGYAPGETMQAIVRLDSTWSEANTALQSATIQLIRHTTLHAAGRTRAHTVPVTPLLTLTSFREPVPITIPSLPPTYMGGLGQDVHWSGQVKRFGGRWAEQRPDPVKWCYFLRVDMRLSVPGCSPLPLKVLMDLPIVVCGMGLSFLPSLDGATAPQMASVVQATSLPLSGAAAVSPHDVHATVVSKAHMDSYTQPLSPTVDVQTFVFPTKPSPEWSQPAVAWHTLPAVQSALPRLAHAHTQPSAAQAAVVIRDAEEDCNVGSDAALTYAPVYYVSASPVNQK